MYIFYVNEKKRKVICVGNYNGRTVRGTATCSEEDEFNIAIGKALAQRRCEVNIAEKKYKEARRRLQNASKAVEEANVELNKANKAWFAAQRELSGKMKQAVSTYSSLLNSRVE